MTTRDEHLAWCKSRALAYVERGELAGAIASMLSDLGQWDEPLYQIEMLKFLITAGMSCKTAGQVRHWIEGFG